jgi:hypothetical protein
MSALPPMAMPYAGRAVPHVVIEVNQQCDIRCRACYKDKYGYSKSLEEIQGEVELALRERDLSLVTLAGGEPSLHPRLEEVIAYIAGRGVAVQMLSNGYQLTEEKLRRYKAAGLAKVYLHVDSHQRRPDARPGATEAELDTLRDEIAARATRAGVPCALSLTLYRDSFAELGSLVRFVLGRPDFHRLLAICCTDVNGLASCAGQQEGAFGPDRPRPDDLSGQTLTNAEVEAALAPLGMEPFAYIPSERDPDARRWLLYQSFVVSLPDGRQHVLHASSRYRRLVAGANALSLRLRGRYPFGKIMSGRGAALALLLYAVTSLHLPTALAVLALLARALAPGARLHQKTLVFQEGPHAEANGEIDYCKDCPDATVRNGKLVPVCMADVLSPVPKAGRRLPAAQPPAAA